MIKIIPVIISLLCNFAAAQCVDADANSYKTMIIGKSEWMAENLKVKTFGNGTPIFHAQTPEDWVEYCNSGKAAYCHLDNDPAKGVLYNWFAVADTGGLAPKGWHVANDADWAELADAYGGLSKAGKRMRVLPKGKKKKSEITLFQATAASRMRYMSGAFEESSDKSYWWSSSHKESGAGYRWISSGSDRLHSDMCNRRTGYSVRCVKNK